MKKIARRNKRVVNKPANRQKLIQATLDTIVDVGIENASVTEILSKAQLSRGMINLHFASKEALFLEALKYFTQLYYLAWYERLDKVDENNPALRLQTIIESDLDACILNKEYIVIWYEFRGKSRTNKLYRKYTDTRERKYQQIYYDICCHLAKNESLPMRNSRHIAHGIIAMQEGMWIDFYLHSESFNRAYAKKSIFLFLSALFPGQFGQKGAIKY